MVWIKVDQDRGGRLIVPLVLTLRSILKVISRSQWFFLMGHPIFDCGFRKSEKFYIKLVS